MGEIVFFLTAGAFVYFGFKIKAAFGDPLYYFLVIALLIGGFLIERYA